MTSNTKRASGSQVQRTAFAESMKTVYTSIPGHVLAFDPKTQRAQIQIGIQRVDINGVAWVPAPIVDVPVSFPGDGFTVEFQIDVGCEGLVHFSQRCIDAWKQTGGTADNPAARFHNQQDAVFVPGIRSLPNVIKSFSNNGIKLRNEDGSQYAWLKNDGSVAVGNAQASVNISMDGLINLLNASGSIQLLANGNAVINGVVFTPQGKIIAPAGGGFTGSTGIPYESHRHDENGNITGTPRT
jgi:hypothetical protein